VQEDETPGLFDAGVSEASLRLDIVEDSEVIEGVAHQASINLVLALFIITGKAGQHSPVALLISLVFCEVRSPQTWIPRGGANCRFAPSHRLWQPVSKHVLVHVIVHSIPFAPACWLLSAEVDKHFT
jgi:hypothetical protein